MSGNEQYTSSSFENGVLVIPDAVLAYNNKMLYNSYLTLENQLNEVDKNKCPDIYEMLENIVNSIFNAWIVLGYRGQGGLYHGSVF